MKGEIKKVTFDNQIMKQSFDNDGYSNHENKSFPPLLLHHIELNEINTLFNSFHH